MANGPWVKVFSTGNPAAGSEGYISVASITGFTAAGPYSDGNYYIVSTSPGYVVGSAFSTLAAAQAALDTFMEALGVVTP